MLDALIGLCEGKNINKKMTLKTKLKNVKMQISETIQSQFTRVSKIKVQLKVKLKKLDWKIWETVRKKNTLTRSLEDSRSIIRLTSIERLLNIHMLLLSAIEAHYK